MTKARMSIVGESGDMGGFGINELDLETCLQEFPDETLVYLSDKYSIGIDDERREKEYNCFKVLCKVFCLKLYRSTWSLNLF